MKFKLMFEYKDLFEGAKPDIKDLLKNIPSKYVISLMSIINDTLQNRGDSLETQKFILGNVIVNLPQDIRSVILFKALSRMNMGYQLFAVPFIIEVINRELINFREDNVSFKGDYDNDELNILKAYLLVTDEMIERDKPIFIKYEKEKDANKDILRLMWPQLIRQFEFINTVDVFYESHRAYAFMSYLESHAKFGAYATAYFETLGCKSGYDYLARILSMIVPNLRREVSLNPADYFFRIRLTNPEPVLERLVINPEEIRNNENMQNDYRGLKEKPIFEFEPLEYLVPYWNFLYNALYNGLVFSFYNNSGIKTLYEKPSNANTNQQISGFGAFKGVIGKEFSEQILFRSLMTKCFSRKYECMKFFDDNEKFNPDCYYRKGNKIFIIEFKDNLLNSETIQSGSYDEVKNAVDDKFVFTTNHDTGKVSEKGIYQLARNIEYLANNKEFFWTIDDFAKKKKLELRKMTVHPIIIQTNIYFDIPGLNDYLDDKIQVKLDPVKQSFKLIDKFTIINLNYFFDKLSLFADSKIQLDEELQNYHQTIKNRKKKAKRSLKVDDALNAFQPFSFVNSSEYIKLHKYKRLQALEVINSIWNIRIPKDEVL